MFDRCYCISSAKNMALYFVTVWQSTSECTFFLMSVSIFEGTVHNMKDYSVVVFGKMTEMFLTCTYFKSVNRVTVTPFILDLIIEYTPEGGVPQLAELIYKNKMAFFYRGFHGKNILSITFSDH